MRAVLNDGFPGARAETSSAKAHVTVGREAEFHRALDRYMALYVDRQRRRLVAMAGADRSLPSPLLHRLLSLFV
jgi:hypothetical protein